MAMYALDREKDLDIYLFTFVYETFIKDVIKVLTASIADDLKVELVLLCTDDDDVEELNEVYGTLCWQGCDTDQGGFKKWMWYDIMREFNYKVTSTWSRCDCEREMAFTHRQFGKDGKGWTTQLDYIIGPERTTDNAYTQ